MLKYKLININTSEEIICEKVELLGFFYYTSLDLKKETNEIYYSIEENPRRVIKHSKHISGFLGKPIVATTNSNFTDIPLVLDDYIHELMNKKIEPIYTEKDAISFAIWFQDFVFINYNSEGEPLYSFDTSRFYPTQTAKEFFDEWKSKQPEKIYFKSQS